MTLSTLKKESIATVINSSIAPRHWEEWRESSVRADIILKNVRTIEDPREIDKILGRNTNKRWKHSGELVPAWMVSGVDPLTDEPTLQGVQVKPDITPINKDGKPQKYIGASGMETAPLFLSTGLEGYWKSVIDDILEAVIITEGAKKAASGLTIGIPTISIPGVSTCRKKGRLHQLLEIFAVLGRTFYLCFDNDILHKKPVQQGLAGLARELAARGSKIMVIKLPEGDAKGMDDYIEMHGESAFKELMTNALTFEEWKEEIAESQLDEESKPRSKIDIQLHAVNEVWGDSLRYNSLKKNIELDGRPLNVEHIKINLGRELPLNISKDDAFLIVEFLAHKNTYSPVCDYLDEVEAKFPEIDPSFLDGLAKIFFGSDDPLHAKYFKNFLVASVARARNPGCWMDSALLLVGAQGIRKSTFWRTLYGDDFFSDDLGDGSDKDERMKMHRFWCLEWSEFETVYKRKDIAQLKAFLARRYETFRTPYDRLPKDYKRSCVFAGTTNEKEVLNDPTGNRRFWIIPVSGNIPVEEVQKLRDKIWSAANALYKAGYVYRLNDQEEVTRQSQNEEYEVTDPWVEIINQFASNRDYVTVQEIYHELSIEPGKQDIFNQRRITSVLKRLGYESTKKWVSGKSINVWIQKIAGSAGMDENQHAGTQAVQAVDTLPAALPATPLMPEAVEGLESLVGKGLDDSIPALPALPAKNSANNSEFQNQSSADVEECDRTPEDSPLLIDGVVVDRTISINGFYLGQLVVIKHHPKRDDWIGKQGRITSFGHEYVRISGDMSAKFADVSSVEDCAFPKGSRVRVKAFPVIPATQEYLVNTWGTVIVSGEKATLCWFDATATHAQQEIEIENKYLSTEHYLAKGNHVLLMRYPDPGKINKIFAITHVEKDFIRLGDIECAASDVTWADDAGAADSLRECIKGSDWEMLTQLTEGWPEKFKALAWEHLTKAEKQAINDLKPKPIASSVDSGTQPTKDYDESAVPLLQTKGIYWSISLKSKVEIFTINDEDELKTASCYLLNRNRMLVYPKLIDLRCCEESPRSTLEVGDEVVILVGKRLEEFAKIRFIEDGLIYLKSLQGKQSALTKPYHAHQLAKV